MLPKKNCFNTKNFKLSMKYSYKVNIGSFLFLVSGEKFIPKFAVVVSKKKVKLAVYRNRIRRQLYEIIRLDLLPFILNLSKNSKDKPYKNIICIYQKKDLSSAKKDFLHAIKILKKNNFR